MSVAAVESSEPGSDRLLSAMRRAQTHKLNLDVCIEKRALEDAVTMVQRLKVALEDIISIMEGMELKEMREKRQMLLTDVGEAINTTATFVCLIESGRRKIPQKHLAALERLFGVAVPSPPESILRCENCMHYMPRSEDKGYCKLKGRVSATYSCEELVLNKKPNMPGGRQCL